MSRTAAIIGLVAAIACAAACASGPERSTASFCRTFEREAVALHDKYSAEAAAVDPEGDPLGSLFTATGSLLEAQGDFVVLFDRLGEVAPDDIRPDVEAVHDAFAQQAAAVRGAGSDPLGAIVGGLLAGLQSTGSFDRVQAYIDGNCDLSFMEG